MKPRNTGSASTIGRGVLKRGGNIFWHKRLKKFQVQTYGKRHLGYFKDLSDAVIALNTEIQRTFGPNGKERWWKSLGRRRSTEVRDHRTGARAQLQTVVEEVKAQLASNPPGHAATRTQEQEGITVKQSERRSLSPDDEVKVLEKCLRRCCVCFALDHDASVKKGQLAHLDHDRSNNAVSNFVWLCLNHHDTYDSTTSQTKNLTEQEVRSYQAKLHQAVERREVP